MDGTNLLTEVLICARGRYDSRNLHDEICGTVCLAMCRKKKRCHNDWLTLNIIVFINRLNNNTIPE